MEKLNARQSLFVLEYLKDLNQVQAARRAGYGNNIDSTTTIAHDLMRLPHIKEAIAAEACRRAEAAGVNKEDVLRGLMEIAFADIASVFEENGQLKAIHDMPVETRRAVAAIEVTEHSNGALTRKVKFWPKDRALEMLARHQSLFNDKITVIGSVAERLVKARQRVSQ